MIGAQAATLAGYDTDAGYTISAPPEVIADVYRLETALGGELAYAETDFGNLHGRRAPCPFRYV
jgi:hypothetical protein